MVDIYVLAFSLTHVSCQDPDGRQLAGFSAQFEECVAAARADGFPEVAEVLLKVEVADMRAASHGKGKVEPTFVAHVAPLLNQEKARVMKVRTNSCCAHKHSVVAVVWSMDSCMASYINA
jgi:hypothetical protein